MSFFCQSNYSSSSEDEGFWPPPGRRKRHPAGDRQPDESSSTSSGDCVSNILTRSSAVSIAQSSLKPHRFQFNQSPNSSSGIFSQPANYSYQSSEINFPSLFSGSFDGVQNCPENLNVNLCSRFNACHIDDQPPVNDQFNSSTPPMLRRFLENQNDSRTECSQSLPPVRFQTWMTGSSLSSLCTENNNQFSGMHVEPSVGKSYSSPTVFTEYNSHQQSLRGHSNLHPAKYDSDITVDHYKSLPRLENEILERLIQSQIQCDRLANQLEAQNMEFIQPCIENKFTQKRPRAMVDSENVLGPSITDFSPKPQVNAPRYFTDYTDHAQESDNSYVPNNDPAKSVNNANVLGFEDDDSITRLKDVFQSWLSPLVGRYNELFTNLRVACMRRLESFGQSDCARNQRLIFHAVQAGFTVTSNVIRRLPVSVQQENYLSRNSSERQLSVLNTSLTTDQIEKLVAATFRRLSRHPPPECACHATISAISGTSIKRPISIRRPVTSQELNALDNLLREVCSLAWHLLAEKHGSNGIPSVWYADVDKTAKPGDTYNDKCYRRSYDSDPSAGQVHHYIWPCLILYSKGPIDIQQQYQSKNVGITNKYNIVKSYVLVKGEACTRNPVHAASQKDKAAALLNHEFSCHGVCRSTSPQIYYRSRSTSVRRV